MTRLPIWSWAGRGGWVAAQVRRVCGPSTCGGAWECNTFGVAAHRASPEQVEAATDQVVALYAAGVAMQTIVDRTGIGRTSIRKVLLAEGVPRRPTGHPRMAVSSQAVADLYESGLTMTQVAERLRIKPHLAWLRYLEVRDQRGVTPGRWHKVLLDALEKHPAVLVVATAAAHLRRAPTSAEAHAARRAARALARVGVADTGHVTVTWNGRRASYLSLARPGVDANDPSQVRA